MTKVLYKHEDRLGVEVGVFTEGHYEAFIITSEGLVSVWDNGLENIKYEIPAWLAEGIKKLISEHPTCVDYNKE